MGEGQELYKKAVEAGDISVYLDGMGKIEDEVVATESKKFFSGNEDEVRDRVRRSQESQARRDNAEYDEIKRNLERPIDEVQNEATTVQDMAVQNSLRDRGSDNPIAEEYAAADLTLAKISDRIDASATRGIDSGFDMDEIVVRHNDEAELRTLIDENLKDLILEVARSKFPEFLEQYRRAKSTEEKSKQSAQVFVAPEVIQFFKDFKESFLEDSRIKSVVTDLKTDEAIRLWAERYYKKELTDYLDREMSADNYSI